MEWHWELSCYARSLRPLLLPGFVCVLNIVHVSSDDAGANGTHHLERQDSPSLVQAGLRQRKPEGCIRMERRADEPSSFADPNIGAEIKFTSTWDQNAGSNYQRPFSS